MKKTKMIEVNIEDLIEETIRERLHDLYNELADPFMPIFDGEDADREERKVRKLRKAVKMVHNWFALPEDYL